ncbi:hypothetical protein DFJ69_5974 [Thermomonospora umbrina]|uniref:Uncharacterized protein n=1 Tax=Thermomonospora umbrina TaxID=111806 RepID=A0A3D9SXZ4_9ACTN|nr:hypothetical protein DFJ69_5974 [Thermomonospora umbrina]
MAVPGCGRSAVRSATVGRTFDHSRGERVQAGGTARNGEGVPRVRPGTAMVPVEPAQRSRNGRPGRSLIAARCTRTSRRGRRWPPGVAARCRLRRPLPGRRSGSGNAPSGQAGRAGGARRRSRSDRADRRPGHFGEASTGRTTGTLTRTAPVTSGGPPAGCWRRATLVRVARQSRDALHGPGVVAGGGGEAYRHRRAAGGRVGRRVPDPLIGGRGTSCRSWRSPRGGRSAGRRSRRRGSAGSRPPAAAPGRRARRPGP